MEVEDSVLEDQQVSILCNSINLDIYLFSFETLYLRGVRGGSSKGVYSLLMSVRAFTLIPSLMALREFFILVITSSRPSEWFSIISSYQLID